MVQAKQKKTEETLNLKLYVEFERLKKKCKKETSHLGEIAKECFQGSLSPTLHCFLFLHFYHYKLSIYYMNGNTESGQEMTLTRGSVMCAGTHVRAVKL